MVKGPVKDNKGYNEDKIRPSGHKGRHRVRYTLICGEGEARV